MSGEVSMQIWADFCPQFISVPHAELHSAPRIPVNVLATINRPAGGRLTEGSRKLDHIAHAKGCEALATTFDDISRKFAGYGFGRVLGDVAGCVGEVPFTGFGIFELEFEGLSRGNNGSSIDTGLLLAGTPTLTPSEPLALT
jgi:hypothetical protein